LTTSLPDHLSLIQRHHAGQRRGAYLHKMGVAEVDFNSYATHRGDHLTAQRATSPTQIAAE